MKAQVSRAVRRGPAFLGLCTLALGCAATFAIAGGGDETLPAVTPLYVAQLPDQVATRYFDGAEESVHMKEVWRLMCGSNAAGYTADDLRYQAEQQRIEFENGPVKVVDSGTRAGLNIVFNLGSSVPSEAQTALATAEAYIESQFSDPVTVSINMSFAALGTGILGQTGSYYVSNYSYSGSRAALVADMDGDDVIQNWLPTGSTIPVRFDASTATISNKNSIDWTIGNYRAAVGSVSGTAASMTFNTQYSWDYDPTNGVAGTSFIDVVIHEVGHALGFVSSVDSGADMDALDMFRFQRTDGTSDYNPDTYDEFQTTPRLVDYNNPDDQHITDFISVEYRMSDGYPYQGSHFREQTPNIGLMDPAIASGETHYPNYYSDADIAAFDAIGWDHAACVAFNFTTQPLSQSLCTGDTLTLSVATDASVPSYSWQLNGVALVNDGVHVFGAQTDTLLVVNVDPTNDAGNYVCDVVDGDDGCSGSSSTASVVIVDPLVFTDQPDSTNFDAGDTIILAVVVSGPSPTYAWYHDGTLVANDGRIVGATTQNLVITSAVATDAGEYTCVATNGCDSFSSAPATLTLNSAPTGCPGDANCDGEINFFDIDAFVAALNGQTAWGSYLASAGYTPSCDYVSNNDCNADGEVNFFDIDAFVVQLTSGATCP